MRALISPWVLLLCLSTAMPEVHAQYYVSMQPGGHELKMILAIPPGLSDRVVMSPGAVNKGQRSQVTDLRCSHGTIEYGPNGMFRLPPECSLLTWNVKLEPVPANGVLGALDRSWSFDDGAWAVLSDFSSMPRLYALEGDGYIRPLGTTRLLGATPIGEDAYQVPPRTNVPENYVLGNAQVSHRMVGSLAITDVADDLSRVERLGLLQLHTCALGYISRVLPMPPSIPDAERSLMVVWIGIAKSEQRIGGSAGHKSFIANYILDDDGSAGDARAMEMMTMAHEQFHQLAEMLRGSGPAMPFWLNESLAQYYGLKAVQIADPSAPVLALRAHFIDTGAPVGEGLTQLNNAAVHGDGEAQERIYVQGATFWAQVDELIQASTAGRQSLDDYVASLVTEPVDKDGSLPSDVAERLREIIGPEFDTLVAKYIMAGTVRRAH